MPENINKALKLCKYWHGDQKRKYTGEPYWHHPKEVMEILKQHTNDENILIAALLHDVVEDTPTTEWQVKEHFNEEVAKLVMEVTNVSKPEDGNRRVRKELDRQHVAKASDKGKLIKLADLISNTGSIVQHDPDFAVRYMEEKKELLKVLKIDHPLYDRAMKIVETYYEQGYNPNE